MGVKEKDNKGIVDKVICQERRNGLKFLKDRKTLIAYVMLVVLPIITIMFANTILNDSGPVVEDKILTLANISVTEKAPIAEPFAVTTMVEEVVEKNKEKLEDLKGDLDMTEEEVLSTLNTPDETEPEESANKITAEYGTYDYYCEIIKQKAIENGVNYKIAIAISRYETGNWKSSLFKNGYNFGGMYNSSAGRFSHYSSLEEGLNAYINLLVKYTNNYGEDLNAWGKRYCPPGDSWASAVRAIMREIP